MSYQFIGGAVLAVVMATGASAATLVNGSLTGPISNGGVPAGWTTLLGSPDTMDENNNVGTGTPFTVAPSGPSPDGGTWVGFAGGFNESFGQNITDFVIGQNYNLSWFAGNFGAETGVGYNGPNAIEVLLDGVSIGMGAVHSTGSNWFAESIQFQATATSGMLAFRLFDMNTNSYMSIDGIAIDVANIPVPASLLLLGTALAGLGGIRRRKRR